jgi:hypothetical protein
MEDLARLFSWLCRRRAEAAAALLGALALLACGELAVPILERAASTSPSEGGVDQASDGGAFHLRVEAEARRNVLVQSATVDDTCFGTGRTCAADGVMEGANCCSAGAAVSSLLGRVPCSGPPGGVGDYEDCQMMGGGVEFQDVTVPEAGTYDVTWWYHCGENNTYGDKECCGVNYPSTGSVCRPQLIDVNGKPMESTLDGQTAAIYQFPCYSGAWSILHAATTALPLNAGANIIFVHAPHAIMVDAVDVDALDVTPSGQGAPPLVTPVASEY